MNNIEKAIKKIEAEGVGEIIKIAIENSIEGCNSIVFYDPDDDTFCSATWTSGTYLNPESHLEEVFRLDGNWIADNPWESDAILSDDEYEELKKAVAKKEGLTDEYDIEYAANFLDSEKLELIGISLKERLIEYLEWCETKTQILEELRGQNY